MHQKKCTGCALFIGRAELHYVMQPSLGCSPSVTRSMLMFSAQQKLFACTKSLAEEADAGVQAPHASATRSTVLGKYLLSLASYLNALVKTLVIRALSQAELIEYSCSSFLCSISCHQRVPFANNFVPAPPLTHSPSPGQHLHFKLILCTVM